MKYTSHIIQNNFSKHIHLKNSINIKEDNFNKFHLNFIFNNLEFLMNEKSLQRNYSFK
jgi:hypothetical protein